MPMLDELRRPKEEKFFEILIREVWKKPTTDERLELFIFRHKNFRCKRKKMFKLSRIRHSNVILEGFGHFENQAALDILLLRQMDTAKDLGGPILKKIDQAMDAMLNRLHGRCRPTVVLGRHSDS